MSHYSDDPAQVRVDFFRKSGKWYTTEAVKWTGEYKGDKQLIYDAFKQSLKDHFGVRPRLSDTDAVCLEPYHEHSHPICVRDGEWLK